MITLAAYTGPTPPTGYVGYVNLSLGEDGVCITVRPESADGSGTACHTIPVTEAVAMLEEALTALRAQGEVEAERERIVDWLREQAVEDRPFGLCGVYGATWALRHAASAIERGDHRKEPDQ